MSALTLIRFNINDEQSIGWGWYAYPGVHRNKDNHSFYTLYMTKRRIKITYGCPTTFTSYLVSRDIIFSFRLRRKINRKTGMWHEKDKERLVKAVDKAFPLESKIEKQLFLLSLLRIRMLFEDKHLLQIKKENRKAP